MLARRSTLMDLPGVGPVVAARILADVGDVARFADRNRFASWTGTAPLDASSGEQIRHRLSRAGNRKMNHMLHIAGHHPGPARHPWSGLLPPQTGCREDPQEAIRCLSGGSPTRSTVNCSRTPAPPPTTTLARVREGTAGRLKIQRGRPSPRTSTLRISHFRTRSTDATTDPAPPKALYQEARPDGRLTTEGSRNDSVIPTRLCLAALT